MGPGTPACVSTRLLHSRPAGAGGSVSGCASFPDGAAAVSGRGGRRRSCAGWTAAAETPFQIFSEGRRVVQPLFFGAVQQRYATRPQMAQQISQRGRLSIEFSKVATSEVLPPCRIVAVPPPQLSGGGELFGPVVDTGCDLCQPPRPQAINENTLAIRGRSAVIDSFGPDGHGPPPGESLRANS